MEIPKAERRYYFHLLSIPGRYAPRRVAHQCTKVYAYQGACVYTM